jgi:hypothetical protein
MSIVTIALLVLIVLALAFVAAGAVNLYSADPRARGIQLGLLAVALLLVGVAYEEAGIAWAVILLVVVVVAELLNVLRKRGTA